MRRTVSIAFVAGALALATTAQAIMLEVAMPDMVNTSTDIVRATVTQLNSYWTPDHHSILTDATIQVAESWKGSIGAASAVTVTLRGGKVGDISEQVEDQPDLRPGNDVVLFMQAPGGAATSYRVTNDFQGRYLVQGGEVFSPRLQRLGLADLRLNVQRLATTSNH